MPKNKKSFSPYLLSNLFKDTCLQRYIISVKSCKVDSRYLEHLIS